MFIMEIITLILTSSVVSALITAFINYFSSRKNNMLKYITEERKSWRNEMRGIAENIGMAEPADLKKELIRLKVRINAYGNTYRINSHKDGHIWTLIKELEDEQENDGAFTRKKGRLVEYISLLLKADWERSKKEVRGTYEKVMQAALVLFSITTFSFYYFVEWKATDMTSFLLNAVYLIVSAFVLTEVFRMINNKALSESQNKGKRLGNLAVSLVIYAGGIVWVSYIFFQRWSVWPASDRFVILTCIYISYAINLIELITELLQKYEYEKAVRNLQEGGAKDADI